MDYIVFIFLSKYNKNRREGSSLAYQLMVGFFILLARSLKCFEGIIRISGEAEKFSVHLKFIVCLFFLGLFSFGQNFGAAPDGI
jgi:hypothetical protein